MSVFEQTTEPNHLEELVGEGKKFATVEDLAKGKAESDRFIEDLKRQINEMREDLNKESKIEELLELARQQREAPNDPPKGSAGGTGGGEEPSNTSSALTEEQLKALVESQLSEREKKIRVDTNIATVEKRLEETYGGKASEAVSKFAKDLNMSVDELKGIAASNPTAFFKMTGMDNPARTQSTVFGSSRSSETDSKRFSGDRRNFAYYQKMRKENKGQYYTAQVQHQMYLDASEQGPSFYEN